MKKLLLPLFALSIATSAVSPAFAAAKYAIDPAHAWVNFAINHVGWAKALGSFREVTGNISFDPENVEKSTLDVTINAASVDTNSKDRDDHLRSPDFLNAVEFPTITFKSTKVEKTGDRTGKVTGDLTMLGVTKPVTLDVQWNDEKPLPWDANTVKTGFSAKGSLSALDFGMNKVSDFGLGPNLDLVIEIEAVKE
ncbi:MAG: YceI family protein [Pseudomonadota bacterium]